MDTTLIIVALATVVNLIAIKWKFSKERFADALADIAVFGLVIYIFKGTLGGMQVGMITSAVMSVYFYKYPPNFPPSVEIAVKQLHDKIFKEEK